MEGEGKNAEVALDGIRAGGSRLLMVCELRMIELRQAMDEGDFSKAWHACSQLSEKLTHLHNANVTLGALARGTIKRVDELVVGDELVYDSHNDRIVDIQPCVCGDANCNKRLITVGEGELVIPGAQEMVVATEL